MILEDAVSQGLGKTVKIDTRNPVGFHDLIRGGIVADKVRVLPAKGSVPLGVKKIIHRCTEDKSSPQGVSFQEAADRFQVGLVLLNGNLKEPCLKIPLYIMESAVKQKYVAVHGTRPPEEILQYHAAVPAVTSHRNIQVVQGFPFPFLAPDRTKPFQVVSEEGPVMYRNTIAQ
jgi:hypothetical protein